MVLGDFNEGLAEPAQQVTERKKPGEGCLIRQPDNGARTRAEQVQHLGFRGNSAVFEGLEASKVADKLRAIFLVFLQFFFVFLSIFACFLVVFRGFFPVFCEFFSKTGGIPAYGC